METTHQVGDVPPGHNRAIVIHIDRANFHVDATALTGLQIRELPTPAIGPDRDLYLQGRGHQEDQIIADSQVVTLEDGMHFFSAPRTITPGQRLDAPAR